MKKNDNKKTALRRSIPFLAVFAAVTVLAWILPLRESVSQREKRELTAFPTFSFASLMDGSYFAGIESWFSDTFPGRDHWIDAAQALESVYGINDVVVYGEIGASDAVPVAAEVTPSPAPMQSPEITPAPSPELTAEPTPEPTPEEEEYEWGGEVVGADELVSLGAVIQIGDRAYTYTGFSQTYADRYAGIINRAAELLDGKCRVSSVFVLHGTSLMLPRDYRESIGCVCEEDVLDYMNTQYSDKVYSVDTFTPLLHHNGEYIYFGTDHHWTARGAYYAYTGWAEQMGFTPAELSDFEENVQSPFYGSLYMKADQSRSLAADEVYTYTPPGDIHLFVENSNSDSLKNRGVEYPLFLQIKGNDKYMTFLTGDRALCTLINNDITDGSACLLVKNSNGNPFAYYLTQHYQYVYVTDYRKYVHRGLSSFVDYYDVDDVIFCISSGQAQSQGGCQLLEGFVK